MTQPSLSGISLKDSTPCSTGILVMFIPTLFTIARKWNNQNVLQVIGNENVVHIHCEEKWDMWIMELGNV